MITELDNRHTRPGARRLVTVRIDERLARRIASTRILTDAELDDLGEAAVAALTYRCVDAVRRWEVEDMNVGEPA